MSIDSNSSAKRFNLERASNFMRQFRDPDSRELKKLSANQFMEVWSHYDRDVFNTGCWFKASFCLGTVKKCISSVFCYVSETTSL
ncbi:unnamed protein product [Arctia plantaginis]|uniref:Calbindin-32 n=1 Tax=Arctia plantaginis TaxID=874455 RepID=A0A8S0ZAY8_ARCPL|nr:unnamed protein product [Arctia plantaginis]